MNVAIFWNIAPCSLHINRRFAVTYHLVAESEESMSIAEKERYKGVEGPGGVDYL
jgi:hypothetical protein